MFCKKFKKFLTFSFITFVYKQSADVPHLRDGGFRFRVLAVVSRRNPDRLSLSARVAICRKCYSLQAKHMRFFDLKDFSSYLKDFSSYMRKKLFFIFGNNNCIFYA